MTAYDGAPADVLIAIHAWRSAAGIARFACDCPGKPIIVCLSGTDVYAFQASHPAATLASMEAATALVGLHDLVGRSIPRRFHDKLHIIYQSVPPPAHRMPMAWTSDSPFNVCVIGHLRAEKDPFRAAAAARLLPVASRVRILHAGGAPDAAWAARARAEMAANPRYRWLGEVDENAVQALLASSRAMVLSSTMEGGANVLGEAIVAGVPVIASAIDGSLGLLGPDYPGTYPVGGTMELARLLERIENDAPFLAALTARCAALAPRFAVDRERQALANLIAAVTGTAARSSA